MKKLLNLVLLVLLVSLPAQADRLFTTGFEENNFVETMWNSSTAAIITSPVHSGTYLAELTTGDFLRRRLPTVLTSGTLFTRYYFRTAAFPSGTRLVSRWRSTGAASAHEHRTLSTGAVRLINGVTGTSVDSSFTLSVDTWYRFELRHLISDTVGELELRIHTGDSTTIEETLSITSEDTLPTNVLELAFDSEFATNLLDDIAVNDANGTFQNSFPGPAKTFLLKPSGDNTVTWTKDGSAAEATNWEGVDDLPGAPDDGTTYNSKTSNGTDKLDLSNLGAEVTSDADIILLDVYGRAGSNGTSGGRDINFEIWDEADANTTGPDFDCKINGWRIADTDEHLVFDAGARTKANLDSFRIGYTRTVGGGTEIRITAEWINVEWIEAAAVTVKPARREILID